MQRLIRGGCSVIFSQLAVTEWGTKDGAGWPQRGACDAVTDACACMRGHAWIARLLEDALLVRIVRGSCALARRRGREAHAAVSAGHEQSSGSRFFIQRSGFSKVYSIIPKND